MSSLTRCVCACVLLVLLSLHLHCSEAHITFFSPNEMKILKGKKDMEPRSEDGQLQDVNNNQPLTDTEHNTERSVELTLRLSPRQLDQAAPAVEELIHELVEERQTAR